MKKLIWVLQRGKFPFAVFDDKDKAIAYIEEKKVTGIMTGYPINDSTLSWAVENELFMMKKEVQKEVWFEENFTSIHQPHYHFENGKIDL